MRQQVIAKRYARALFAIGREQGGEAHKTFGQELAGLAEVLDGAPKLLRLFKNPIIRTQDKRNLVLSILDKLEVSQMTKNFCLFLADKGRLGNFPEIQQYYNKLLDLDEGILRGKLITAIDLTKTKQDKIKKDLEAKMSSTLVLDYEKDKAILGGLVLKVGDKVYDASLKAQLELMKENIKRGE